jgi:hypothetical protein
MASRLTNSTELVIGDIVAGQRARISPREGRCRCAACEADITALTLSSLPPQYFTTVKAGDLLMGKEMERLEVAVESAAARVARNPKDGRPGTPPSEVRLVNYTFEEGTAIVDDLVGEGALPCSCDECCSDILAYALNRFPAKYGVERDGRTALRQRDRENIQQDLAFFVRFAAGVVSRRPRHS